MARSGRLDLGGPGSVELLLLGGRVRLGRREVFSVGVVLLLASCDLGEQVVVECERRAHVRRVVVERSIVGAEVDQRGWWGRGRCGRVPFFVDNRLVPGVGRCGGG